VALYAAVLVVVSVLVLATSYWLVGRHLHRTLPDAEADDALSDLAGQYGLALLGAIILAVALGWIVAGRALAPLKEITATAKRVSEERLDERIALTGPRDELRELAETFDAMLDRLAEAFDSQRRFVANAGHELRSPLTVIRTEADVALANPDADVEELREVARAVLEATDRTEALLEALLVLAHSQQGLLRSERVDLAGAVETAIAGVAPEAASRDVMLLPDLHPAFVLGDRRLLERLVANLLENGVRYNRPGGGVRVDTRSEPSGAVLRVVNTGPVVSPEAVARLTEPFQRLERAAGDGGSGLGLSIVRAVAEAHGGAVHLRAQPAGGLEAEVRLPAAVTAGSARTPVA
jgi:signal transduction histidine kinase